MVGNEIKSFQDLKVWQKSMGLAKDIYEVTNKFPEYEKFGMTSQMRRAAVSIPSNISEGHARTGSAEFVHFLSIVLGSAAELETQIILSFDLKYMDCGVKDSLLRRLTEIRKMAKSLRTSLTRKTRK